MQTLKVTGTSVEVDGQTYSDFSRLPGVRRAEKRAVAPAVQLTEPLVLVQADGAEKRGEPGDWVLQAVPGDVYIVPERVFRETYRIVSD
jgi:hypothetical protein